MSVPARFGLRLIISLLLVIAGVLTTATVRAQSGVATIAAEATIYEEDSSENGGGDAHYCIGNLSSTGATRRGFLRFNLPAIPPGAVITRVEYDFTQNNVRTQGAGPLTATLQMRRVNESWVEGTGSGTGSGPCGGGANVAGVDWDSQPPVGDLSATEGLPSVPANITIDTDIGADDDGLITDVQGWVDGTFGNFGWRIQVAEETTIDNARRMEPGSITIYWTVPAPDLVVIDPDADNLTPEEGENFTVSATVQNTGDGASNATTLRFLLSTDSDISLADMELATDAVGALAPDATSPQEELVSVATAGTYWVGACVDQVAGESNTSNQCSSGVQIEVQPPPPPDLVVINPGSDNLTPEEGEPFTVSATVQNMGAGDADATTLRFLLSTDSVITLADVELATDPVGALGPAATSPESEMVSVATAGMYWVGACVDAVAGESNTTNQCSSGVQIEVQPPPPPDLVVIDPDSDNLTPNPGEAFTVSATVQNIGVGASDATTLRYFLSNNAVITTSDKQLATDAVGALDPEATSPEDELVSVDTAGTYWVGACVDAVANESNTSNQCSVGVEITIPPGESIFGHNFEGD